LKSIFLATIQFPLYVLAFAGVRRAWRRHAEIRILALIVVYYIMVHAFIVGWARYSVPIVPMLIVLAVGVAQFPRGSNRIIHPVSVSPSEKLS
jgi:CHASE2 domain-containing sensor protein